VVSSHIGFVRRVAPKAFRFMADNILRGKSFWYGPALNVLIKRVTACKLSNNHIYL
jgi:hypothetical protein